MKSSKMTVVDPEKEKENQIIMSTNKCEPLYKKKLMYIQKLVNPVDNSSVEYSFEEIRAQAYYPIFKEREKMEQQLNDLKKQLAAASLQSKTAPQKVSSTTQMNEICTNTTISLNEMNKDTRSKVSKASDTTKNDRTDYNLTNVTYMTTNRKSTAYDYSEDTTTPYINQKTENLTVFTKQARNEVNNFFENDSSTDTRTSEHTVSRTDDRTTKHYDDNTISQTDHIDQTSFAKAQDFTIFKNSHFSHVMEKSEFTHQLSQFEQENERKRNEERNNHMRKPLHAVDPSPQPIVQTEDYAIDDDFQNTYQIPSTSKFSQLNDQYTAKLCFDPDFMSTRCVKFDLKEKTTTTDTNDCTHTVDKSTNSFAIYESIVEPREVDRMAKMTDDDLQTNYGWSKLKETGDKRTSQTTLPKSDCETKNLNNYTATKLSTPSTELFTWDHGHCELGYRPTKPNQIKCIDEDVTIFDATNKLSTEQTKHLLATSNHNLTEMEEKSFSCKKNYYKFVDITTSVNDTQFNSESMVFDNPLKKQLEYTGKALNFSQSTLNVHDASKLKQSDQTDQFQLNPNETARIPLLDAPRSMSLVIPDEPRLYIDDERHAENNELLTMDKFNQTMTQNFKLISDACLNGTTLHTNNPFGTITTGYVFSALDVQTKATTKYDNMNTADYLNMDFQTTAPGTLDTTLMMAIKEPFNSEYKKRLLAKQPNSFLNRSNYLDMADCRNMPHIHVNKIVSITDSKLYKVIRNIGSGAFAKIFLIKPNEKTRKEYALKVSEQPCAWEYYVTDIIHQRIKLLNSSIDLTDSFIKMIQFTKYSDGSFALMKYYKNGTLLDLVNYHVQTNQHIPYWFVIYLTIELLSIINGLHKCKIIHADVKPDNIMVDQLPFDISFFDQTKTKSLVLIDFNQSIDLNLYPETVEFNNKFTAKFKLCQVKADKNWTFQIDYFGMMSCIYSIIFKKYMNTYEQDGQFKLTEKFPRSYDRLYTRFFDTFLNIPSCNQLPDLELEWIPSFVDLFRKDIANYPKSSKYLKELSKYYDSGTHVSGSSTMVEKK